MAKSFPIYWYIRTNAEISSMAAVTEPLGVEIVEQILVVFFHAVAVFALTTVLISAKRKRAA